MRYLDFKQKPIHHNNNSVKICHLAPIRFRSYLLFDLNGANLRVSLSKCYYSGLPQHVIPSERSESRNLGFGGKSDQIPRLSSVPSTSSGQAAALLPVARNDA